MRDGPLKVYVVGWLIVTGVFVYAIKDQYSIIEAQTRIQKKMNEQEEHSAVLTQHIHRQNHSKSRIDVYADQVKITKTFSITPAELKDIIDDAKSLKESTPGQLPGIFILNQDSRLNHWIEIDGEPKYQYGNQMRNSPTSVEYRLLSDKLQMFDQRLPDVY